MGFLSNLQEKSKEKAKANLPEKLREHLQPGESAQRFVYANVQKDFRGLNVLLVATERNVYAFDITGLGRLKEGPVKFPIKTAVLRYRDEDDAVVFQDRSHVLATAADGGERYGQWTVWPSKPYRNEAPDLVAYVNALSEEPDAESPEPLPDAG